MRVFVDTNVLIDFVCQRGNQKIFTSYLYH